MKLSCYTYWYKIIILSIVAVSLAGCATTTSHFTLAPSLAKDIRSFDSVQYVPLVRVCDAYGLDCKWDGFAKTATIENRSNTVVLRAGSDRALVNGEEKKLEKPVVFSSGAVFVPVAFVKNNLGPIAGPAPVPVPPEIKAPKKFTIKTIVIDPGHGGRDPGAIGKIARLYEKEATLSIAKKVRDALERSGVRVIMTRDSDTFVSLPKRAQTANASGADLFVSIHINASRSRTLRGFECYYLSNATDDNARAIEAFENSSLRMGESASAEHSKQLDKTLWDMTLTENRRESSELASYICDSVDESFTIASRGVRSARFYVLKYTRMPAVLVETAYISNRYEEMKLKEPKFQQRVADAIAEGILRYKKELERTEGFTRS